MSPIKGQVKKDKVGRCFYYGIGIEKNKRIADIWLEKAEELGTEFDK